MRRDAPRNAYEAWLTGEVLLLGLLTAALTLFASEPRLHTSYELPELRLVIATAITVTGALVAILSAVRFGVEGRRLDLLLTCGFSVAAASTLAFSIAPSVGGGDVGAREAWAGVASGLLAGILVAAAPFARGRISSRAGVLRNALFACGVAVGLLWLAVSTLVHGLPDPSAGPLGFAFATAMTALLNLLALVGFGLRFRSGGEELHRWLGLGCTFLLFASLWFVLTPATSSTSVSQGDFLRVLGYGVLLVGVWRAIRAAEFGRAVAEERARVASEIHDGLAQYLFALSTHATMLEGGAPPDDVLPRLKEAAIAAQQEARFAILALSSASGTAPFDAALQRYVEFLTADGALDVELEIDSATRLAPDEQIEIFRIVQEGLANVRRHAGATRAEVKIGQESGRRFVRVLDDGSGFEERSDGAGQGLRNMRMRAASVGGAFELRSGSGRGTAVEITLRA
jgi:signal transduction histidine kinase